MNWHLQMALAAPVGYIEGRNDCQEIVGELGDMGHPSLKELYHGYLQGAERSE